MNNDGIATKITEKCINLACLLFAIVLLIVAYSIPNHCMTYDGIIMGCYLDLDMTRSEDGVPLSEALIDF